MEAVFYAKAAAFIGAAIAMGLGSIGPALGQGWVGAKSCESIGKNPESGDKVRMTMMIAMAIIESSAIYAFLISLLLILFNK